MKNISTRDITLIAVFGVLLTLQEELLAFIPNVSLTVFLIVLYSKVFGTKRTLLILVIHVALDNFIMGNMSPIFVPCMYVGWALIPILLNTVFKNASKTIHLALLGAMFSFLYCWIYIVPAHYAMGVSYSAYILSDILFEVILAVSSFLSILWLYDPCYRILSNLYNERTQS